MSDKQHDKWNRMPSGLIFFIVMLVLAVVVFLIVGSSPKKDNPAFIFSPSEDEAPSCESVKYQVYVTSGHVSAIDVTLSNATGDTEQGQFSLPLTKTYRMCDSFMNFKYISSQIVEPTSGAGSIECKITVDGVVVSTAKASGFPSIAGCSD